MRNHMLLYVFFPNIKASVYIGYIGIHIWCIFTLKITMDGFEHEVAGNDNLVLTLQLKSILSQRDSFRINAASTASPN